VQLNLKYDQLLAKDVDGPTALHVTAWCGYKEIVENLWIWAREVKLNLRGDLLLNKNMYR
jgi:hypothetical protein